MVHETVNRSLISNPFVRDLAPKLGWFYFIYPFALIFFDMQIFEISEKKKLKVERGPMMMSFGG